MNQYAQRIPDPWASLESVRMDLWPAYIKVTLEHGPGARKKIALDRFHAARCLGDAVDKVRAWVIKETAMKLWPYVRRTWACKGWERWLSWAVRYRLEPMKAAARAIRNHLGGLINAIILKVGHGFAEGRNSRIKTVKVCSRGFRNKQRFVHAIYFSHGGDSLPF